MDSKKVLVIGLASAYGGIESFFINVFRNIDKTKIKFDFITFFPVCAYEDELEAAGCKIYHVTRRGSNPIKNYLELTSFFKTHGNEYDYVWYHTSSSSNVEPLVISKKYCNAKTIVHCHGTNFESSAIARPVHIMLQKINFEKMKKHTDYPFACSKAAGNYLFKDEFGKVIVVNNGIDIDSYVYNKDVRNLVRNEIGVSSSTVVIGHAGRLCEVKNQKFLIEAFAEYQKINPDSILVIAGEGELKAQLAAQANEFNVSEKVMFLGYRNDLNRLVQGFDMFMLPSFSEGFPVSLIESQAAGLSCLVSDVVTNEVLITDLVTFESLDNCAEVWAKRIEEIVKNKSYLRNNFDYSANVRSAGFDVKDNAKIIENFFIKAGE